MQINTGQGEIAVLWITVCNMPFSANMWEIISIVFEALCPGWTATSALAT